MADVSIGVLGTVGGANTIAAAGDYAANDVVSNNATTGSAWLFPNLARSPGGSGLIISAVITGSVEGLVPRMRLWLFDSNPSGSELRDNVARSIVVADRSKLLGKIDFPAMADIGTVSEADNSDIRLSYTAAAGSQDIYGILETLDAFTNESASMTITIRLQALQE